MLVLCRDRAWALHLNSVAESDLKAKHDCVKIFKFADDVDMITTTDNHDKIPEELQRIESWAAENNLVLNKTKTKEIVFHNRGKKPQLPPPMDGIDRVAKFRKLGVILQETLSMKEHVNDVLADCTQYAVRDEHSEIPWASHERTSTGVQRQNTL